MEQQRQGLHQACYIEVVERSPMNGGDGDVLPVVFNFLFVSSTLIPYCLCDPAQSACR